MDKNPLDQILPTNSYAFKNRALVYFSTDKKELACLDLQKALELGFQEDYGDEVAKLLAEHCH
jgi:lipoprotein NlpI